MIFNEKKDTLQMYTMQWIMSKPLLNVVIEKRGSAKFETIFILAKSIYL